MTTTREAGDSGAADLDVAGLLSDPAVSTVICCGSGGVGKTSASAAMALHAAERGRRVVVLTIDPARRLAQSLGISELGNVPTTVPGIDTEAGGSLDAMMLDMKRTFDEVVAAHASPQKAAQIMANPFYQALSSSFAGTSEYMAMEKLGQLRAQAEAGEAHWDLIVVDTPPSRSALDFLDAPQRLVSFLDGRFLRLLTAPVRTGGRAYVRTVTSMVSGVTGVMNKVLGAQVLTDMQNFVTALDSIFGGFRERAEATYAQLQAAGTAFVVVATPHQDALREAGYFVRRLRSDSMPLAGVLVNRVVTSAVEQVGADSAGRAADVLAGRAGLDQEPLDAEEPVPAGAVDYDALTASVLRVHAELMRRQAAGTEAISAFRQDHPGVAIRQLPALPEDVHDVEGLRRLADAAAG